MIQQFEVEDPNVKIDNLVTKNNTLEKEVMAVLKKQL